MPTTHNDFRFSIIPILKQIKSKSFTTKKTTFEILKTSKKFWVFPMVKTPKFYELLVFFNF